MGKSPDRQTFSTNKQWKVVVFFKSICVAKFHSHKMKEDGDNLDDLQMKTVHFDITNGFIFSSILQSLYYTLDIL